MPKNKPELLEALALLDKNDNAHWNTEGLPRVDVVSKIMRRNVSRQEITEVAPEFSLLNPVLPEDESWMDKKDEEVPETLDATVSAVAVASSPSVETVASVAPAPTDEMTALLKQIGDKDTFLRQAKMRKDKIEQEIAAAEKEISGMNDLLEKKFPPKTHAEITQEFIASQLQQRMDRAMAVQKIKDTSGIALNSKAPIDAAMQRGTGYGHNRPKVPLAAQG